MKRILVVIFLLVFPITIFAQLFIEGKIFDKSTEEPLAGAVVRIEKTVFVVEANANGYFKISGLSKADYIISVSMLGYVTQRKTIFIEKNTVLNIKLEKTAIIQDEIVINATRADNKTPVAAQNIDFKKIKPLNLGQDIPVLLNQLPSVVTNSDAGAGIGYTGIRIRGSDITRINVTVNGIPLNDPESHGVWFVNMPDFASSVNNLQVQRGVGTSTNGAGAFGASMNFMTTTIREKPYAEINSAIGSYSTLKNSFSAGTGVVDSMFSFDFRLSQIGSDGFVDRSFSELKSYFISANFFNKRTFLRIISFSGKEKTFQAWWGVPKAKLNNDTTDIKRYLNHGLYSENQYKNLIQSDPRTYNFYTYENETDNYQQTHYQLHLTHELSDNLMGNISLHYTKGKGFYEQFRENDKFSSYGLSNLIIGNDTINRTELVRQKWLDNDFYGATWSLIYQRKKLNAVLGGSLNQYKGQHFGNIIRAEFASTIPHNFEWYRNTGVKNDFSSFIKTTVDISTSLSFFADVQFRRVNYTINGNHDDLRDISMLKTYNFFNPKTGLLFEINNNHQLFFSFAATSKEPSRNEFRDADENFKPLPEQLFDIESGYQLKYQNIIFNTNLYYMIYKNQLVLTGKINNVGSPITSNVDQSFRRGVEISMLAFLHKNIEMNTNMSISENKILNFTEFVDDWDNGGQIANFRGKTNISFSPSLVFSNQLLFSLRAFKIYFLSKYVGKQYIDNASNDGNTIDAYFVNDLVINYLLKLKSGQEIETSLKVNNLFNHQYEANAWVYRYIYEGKYYNMDGYFPQANRNFLLNVSFRI